MLYLVLIVFHQYVHVSLAFVRFTTPICLRRYHTLIATSPPPPPGSTPDVFLRFRGELFGLGNNYTKFKSRSGPAPPQGTVVSEMIGRIVSLHQGPHIIHRLIV